MMKIYTLLGVLRTVSLFFAATLAGWMALSLFFAMVLGWSSAYLFLVVGVISLIAFGFALAGLGFGALKKRIGRKINRETMGVIQHSSEEFKAALEKITAASQTSLA